MPRFTLGDLVKVRDDVSPPFGGLSGKIVKITPPNLFSSFCYGYQYRLLFEKAPCTFLKKFFFLEEELE